MVSQGRRQFEGLPNEDSGATGIICSKLSNGNSQKLFENTEKPLVNTIDNHLINNINNLENGRLYNGNHDSYNKDNYQATSQTQVTQLENENDMTEQNCKTLFVRSKDNQDGRGSTINDDSSKLMNTCNHELVTTNSIIIDMEETGLNSFELSKDQHFHSAITSQPHNQSKITRKNKNIPQSQIDLLHKDSLRKNESIGHVEQSPVMQQASPDDNCEDFYMSSEESPLQDTHENHQEISCSSQTVSSGSIVYTSVSSEDPRIVSNNLQTSRKTRLLTLGSESQLLLSGVPSIPEQLPLILTEGDAEEQESLSLARTEQFQAVSTQAVLGANHGSGGLMVFSSSDISASGHLIPISGTNLVVLQSIDGQGQVIQPSSVIVAGQSQLFSKPIEQMSHSKINGKQYNCPHDGCTKIAPTSSKLKLHMLSHTGERPHKCPLEGCDWAFTTAYKLKRHIRGHTGERPFICELEGCGKCFTTTYNLRTHQKAHIREQDNICSFEDCEQSFSTLYKLKLHEKKHQLENELHTCNFGSCGKQFKSLSNYNAHVKTHSCERPHACSFDGCGKRFTKASKLKLHVRTHTGERPFVCEEEGCDWSFTSAYKLKRHSRKHTGERPFTCEFAGCGRSFTRASHMRTHALSHTGQKPYICPLSDCLKGFTAASSLNIHMRKHTGDKPFKCAVEGCDKAYTTGANLRLHQKRHENRNLNEDESMEKEEHETSDHPIPVHYVEIGGVNSVVETDPNSAPATPYSVMHSFTGEDFATEDITSLTVVQFPSEETFPPQAPTTTMDSASGICFQFSSSDSYANPPHSSTSSSISGLSFTAGTSLPSPGAQYSQTNIAEVDVESSEDLGTSTNEGQFLEKCSHDSPRRDSTQVRTRDYIVREQTVCREGTLAGPGDKEDDDLTLPTMVVFTSPGVHPPEHSSTIPQTNDLEAGRSEENRNSDRNIRHLTLQQPCESSSIEGFEYIEEIFQGEEMKAHADRETERSDLSLTNHCRTHHTRSSNLSGGLPVSNLSLNLASLSEDIDKSPVSPFITDVNHSLDHESTINLQDLKDL